MARPVLYLLDASLVFFRYYFALPNHWHSNQGVPTNAVFGFAHWLKRLILNERPQWLAACFDESLQTGFRHELDPAYKSNRVPADHVIQFQFAACKHIAELMGVPVYASTRFEADDLIGTLAARHRARGGSVCILSRDKDLLQLLGPEDHLWDYPGQAKLAQQDCMRRFGVAPHQFADYLALVGDSTDAIAGVPGVGSKTAQALLAHFGSVDALFDDLDSVLNLPIRGAKRIQLELARGHARVLLNRQLTTIVTNATLNRKCELRKKPAQNSALSDYIAGLGFVWTAEL